MSIALLLIFLALMCLGVPIAISLGAASVIVLITMGNMPLTMVVQLMYTSMNSFVMVAVPLFILAGSLMDEGGIADKIYELADSCVGWIYGGLGHVSILCNIIFGAMSGSSVAAVASIGKMSINAMAKKGYPKEYGVGINLAGCMLASVIPPSILMIVAASTAGESIGKALMAGMVPGVLIGLIYMVYNFIHCKITGYGEKSAFSARRLGKAFFSAIPALMVPVILLTGMYSGIYTPTEGAGIAVAYAVLISIYVYKRLKWSDLPRIICKNARQTGTILFIAIAAKPAGQIFELDGLPTKLANFILAGHYVPAFRSADCGGHVHGRHCRHLYPGAHSAAGGKAAGCKAPVLRSVPGHRPQLRTDHPSRGRVPVCGRECHWTAAGKGDKISGALAVPHSGHSVPVHSVP